MGKHDYHWATRIIISTIVLPKELFDMSHVDHVVLPSHLLKVQGKEVWLVALDCLLKRKQTLQSEEVFSIRGWR